MGYPGLPSFKTMVSRSLASRRSSSTPTLMIVSTRQTWAATQQGLSSGPGTMRVRSPVVVVCHRASSDRRVFSGLRPTNIVIIGFCHRVGLKDPGQQILGVRGGRLGDGRAGGPAGD